MKKLYIIIPIIILVLSLIAWFIMNQEKDVGINLPQLKEDRPDLAQFVDEVQKWKTELENDKDNFELYTTLGLAWKALADKTQDPKYYQAALAVYEEAIKATKGKNAFYWHNAGVIKKRLGNLDEAEQYFKKAIELNPGDPSLYLALVDLYEYSMNKSKEEVVEVFDQGISRIMYPEVLEKRKEQYLLRVEKNSTN